MCIVQSKTELRCGATVDDGVAIYARLVQLYTDPPNNFVRAARPYPACIGSAKFQKVWRFIKLALVSVFCRLTE